MHHADGTPSTFREFLNARIPAATDVELAQKSGISRWTLSRQIDGENELKVGTVVGICRAFELPLLAGFAAAGFITDEEASRESASPDITSVSEEQLLREMLRRVAMGNTSILDAPITNIDFATSNVGGQSDDVRPPIDLHAVDLSEETDLAASHDDSAVHPDNN